MMPIRKWLCIFILAMSTLCLGKSYASPYDFNWKDKNDMRGAWMLCAPTGFTLGDCPKVLQRCWRPPMIYFKRKRGKLKIKTHCTKLPRFSMSEQEVTEALLEAKRRMAN